MPQLVDFARYVGLPIKVVRPLTRARIDNAL